MALDRKRFGLRVVSYSRESLEDASHQLDLLSFPLSVAYQFDCFRDLAWTAFTPICYNEFGRARLSPKDS